MLRCGPSNRTFVHYAAFLLAETSVCGTLQTFAFVKSTSAFRHPTAGRIQCIKSVQPLTWAHVPSISWRVLRIEFVISRGRLPKARQQRRNRDRSYLICRTCDFRLYITRLVELLYCIKRIWSGRRFSVRQSGSKDDAEAAQKVG
jgi:hypothetical protein